MCFILDKLSLYHEFTFVFLVVHSRPMSSNALRQFVEGAVLLDTELFYITFFLSIFAAIVAALFTHMSRLQNYRTHTTPHEVVMLFRPVLFYMWAG